MNEKKKTTDLQVFLVYAQGVLTSHVHSDECIFYYINCKHQLNTNLVSETSSLLEEIRPCIDKEVLIASFSYRLRSYDCLHRFENITLKLLPSYRSNKQRCV